jgi:serine/threonine-protein kinase
MTSILDELNASLRGRYLVEDEIGEGGMATVYRARDVRHDRHVAIKVLHPELAAVIGAERFLAEIRTTANLQHPHILPLHDSGNADGKLFYVMPFVEGVTLRQRIMREHQLPIGDAVRIASEVASALGYAHRHGVIHRDIKPENILLHDGSALVADFGIAIAASKAGTRMTETGMSLGTPQYMSPEQAMGERDLDARSDIYALGCITYEMLAGEPPFSGPTAQAIVAKVMTANPAELSSLRASVPAHVAETVHIALQRIPGDRFATAEEFSAALGASTATPTRTRISARVSSQRAPRTVARALGAAGMLAVAGLVGWSVHRAPSPVPTLIRFSIPLTADQTVSTATISPDGTVIAYSAADSAGTAIYQRRLGELASHLIPGTQGGDFPIFAPDGGSIAFVADHMLKRVALAGGGVTDITPIPAFFAGSAWLDNGKIYFAEYPENRIRVVSATGGASTLLAVHDTSLEACCLEGLHDDHGLLFASSGGRIGAVDVRSGQMHLLGSAVGVSLMPPDVLVGFDDNGALFQQRFDPARLDTLGPRRFTGDTIDPNGGFEVSRNGIVTFLPTNPGLRQLQLIDRHGVATTLAMDHGLWAPRYLPDGREIIYGNYAPGRNTADLWISRLTGGAPTRITAAGQDNNDPEPSPDAGSVAYSAFAPLNGESRKHLFIQSLGTGIPHPIVAMPGEQWTSDWSRDGRFILFTNTVDNNEDIWVFSRKDSVARPYLATRFTEAGARFSPDGRWVAYTSDESGQTQVYVQSFPEPGHKVMVSNDGGSHPAWRGDGRELYFWHNNQLWAAELSATAPLTVRSRTLLFHANYVATSAQANYDVRADGNQFVVLTMAPAQRIGVTIGSLMTGARRP